MVESVNHIKENPVGIDKAIQDIQIELYDYLTKKWSGAIQGFGRVYRNPQDYEVIPEWFNGKEYEPVYYDDNYACNFFFIEDQTHESTDGIVFNAKVKLSFMLNLEKVKPGTHRMDEEVRLDVIKFLNRVNDGRYEITGLQKGIDAVFLGFDKRMIQRNDMHPKHTFCVRKTLYYYLDQC